MLLLFLFFVILFLFLHCVLWPALNIYTLCSIRKYVRTVNHSIFFNLNYTVWSIYLYITRVVIFPRTARRRNKWLFFSALLCARTSPSCKGWTCTHANGSGTVLKWRHGFTWNRLPGFSCQLFAICLLTGASINCWSDSSGRFLLG